MRRALVAIAVVCAAALACSVEAQAKKVAFVVGVDRYDNLKSDLQLRKAVNDARAMSASLKSLGFEVVSGENFTRLDFLRNWQQFLNKVEPGDVAALFFAGHGVEIGGVNYLLPRDIPKVASGEEEVLRASALSLNMFLDQVRSKRPQVSFHIIDACRDNPFADNQGRSIGGSRGLARIEPASGSFVMFSAGAGQTALDRLNEGDPNPNSIYTRTLLKHLNVPGRSLADIAREVRSEVLDLAKTVSHVQTPAYYDEVIGRFCPAGCEGGAPTAVAPQLSGGAAQAWATIQNTSNEELLEAFLQEFPTGFYATLARTRLKELKEKKVAVGVFPKTQQPSAPQPPAQLPASEAIATCDALAGNKSDSDAKKQGVKVGGKSWALKGKAEEALQACEAAVKSAPASARLKYQLARALYESVRFKEAVAMMEEAARDGNAAAMRDLAGWHLNGALGLRRDTVKAFEWHLKAAEAGDTMAMASVAQALWQGVGEPQDRRKANEWYRRAHDTLLPRAEGGDVDAMVEIASYYMYGRGRERDEARYLAWIKRAAERGAEAYMSSLSHTYRNGYHGQAKNTDLADSWQRKYVESLKARVANGDGDAMASLASMTESGSGVVKDLPEALRLYRKSADAGYHFGWFYVALWHQYGKGGEKDPIEADIGYRKYYEWYRRAAEAGDSSAVSSYAYAFQQGTGVSKSSQEALRLYQRAFDQGYHYAGTSIGSMYRYGADDLPKDPAEGYRWYRRSAEASNWTSYSTQIVAEILSKGEGLERDSRKGAETYLRYWSQQGYFDDSSFNSIQSYSTDKGEPMVEIRKELQKLLASAGTFKGPTDGAWNPELRKAIETYVKRER